MGVVELVLIVFSAVLSGVLAALGVRFIPKEKKDDEAPASHPLPIGALLVAAVSVLAAPGLSWALSPQLVSYVVASVPTELIVADPRDPLLARVYAAALIAAWAQLPGLAAIAWLLLSSRRSLRGAAIFATATWVGSTLAMAIEFALLPRAVEGLVDGVSGLGVAVGLLDVMSLSVRAALGFAACGAGLGAAWVAAAWSRRGLRAVLWASAAMPFVASLVAALATPPDVVSQLLMAVVIAACWMLGLGGGVATRAVMSRRAGA